VAERSARADRWFKQPLAEGRASDACLQLEQWGAASVSTPQGVMDSKTQPRADVSPDVNLSDDDSPKVITPVHTVAVYSQSPSPRAAVTFSQAITPPAGLKDATPKPPETVVTGSHADGAETSRSEVDAIDLDTSSHDILHTRSDQLLGATRILLASERLREHF